MVPSRFVTPSAAPGERGPSWQSSHTGGASAALRHRQGANRGLQGLRFAPQRHRHCQRPERRPEYAGRAYPKGVNRVPTLCGAAVSRCGTPARRLRCASAPRSGPGACAAGPRSRRVPSAAASPWPASIEGWSRPVGGAEPPATRRAWCGAHRDALQKLEGVVCVHLSDALSHPRRGPLAPGRGVAGIGQPRQLGVDLRGARGVRGAGSLWRIGVSGLIAMQ